MTHRIKLAACLAATALLTAHPASASETFVVEGDEHCVVNVAGWDRLNVRDEPGSSGEIVTRLRYGTCGIVVTGAPEGNWYPVEDGHFEGWINAKFISMVSPSMYCVTNVDDDDVLNLRAYPSTSSSVIWELPPDQCDIALLPYATNGWQKIRVEGEEGWVKRKFLSGE